VNLSYEQLSIAKPYGPLNLSDHSGTCFFLQSNGKGKNLLAIGKAEELIVDKNDAMAVANLREGFRSEDWWFGYVSYEFKDVTEPVVTNTRATTNNHLLHFVKPLVVAEWEDNHMRVWTLLAKSDTLRHIEKCFEKKNQISNPTVRLTARTERETYLANAKALQRHIKRGDIYEVNYCIDFYAHEIIPNPYGLYASLNRQTKAPYSAYVRMDDLYILCCSPERFLKKEGPRVTMNPIKGTRPRGASKEEDYKLKQELLFDPKERAENTMIVDLVRNDLSKSAIPGTVQVDELCSIHSFETVHQMVSSVSSEVSSEIAFVDLLVDCFPPGSMTGAPKISALKSIDAHEYAQRGIYSGSIGYLRPGGDFELNVVIRTVIYDATMPLISLSVGSALTAVCSPEKEYEECLLKAEALRHVMENEPVVLP